MDSMAEKHLRNYIQHLSCIRTNASWRARGGLLAWSHKIYCQATASPEAGPALQPYLRALPHALNKGDCTAKEGMQCDRAYNMWPLSLGVKQPHLRSYKEGPPFQ